MRSTYLTIINICYALARSFEIYYEYDSPYDSEGAIANGAVGLHVSRYGRRLIIGRRRRQDGALRRALRTALHQRHGDTHGDARVPRGAAYSRHPTAPRLAVTADSSHGALHDHDAPRSPDRSRLTRDNITGYFFIIHARTTMRESLDAHNSTRSWTPVNFHQLFTLMLCYFTVTGNTRIASVCSFKYFSTKDETVVIYYFSRVTHRRPHATEIERDWPAWVGGGSGARARRKTTMAATQWTAAPLDVGFGLACFGRLNTANSRRSHFFSGYVSL